MIIRKKAISLITLIITILIIIVLASIVIISISNNNPYDAANEAVFKSDLDAFRTELGIYHSTEYVDSMGSYNENGLQADTMTIGDVIYSLKNNVKYKDKMQIEDGKLIYICTGTEEDKWAKDIGIEVKCLESQVTISDPLPLEVNSENNVKYVISIQSDYKIIDIVEENIELYKIKQGAEVEDTKITTANVIVFNYIKDEDFSKEVEVTIDTSKLTVDGNYYIKVKAETILMQMLGKQISNSKEMISHEFKLNTAIPVAPDIHANITSPTNQDVIVTIKYYEDSVQKEYKIGNGNWQTVSEFEINLTMTNNTTIIARGINYLGTIASASYDIANIDKTPPAVPTVTYNSGANTNTWKNNYNLTVVSTDSSGISKYQIDWNNDGVVDYEFTGTNFIPWNGYDSTVTRFRALDGVGNIGNWTGYHQIRMDTQAPVHTNWWWGTPTSSGVSLYIQATDNVGIQRVQGPTSTEAGGYANWTWFDAVWDAGANAYRVDIPQSAFGHSGNYKTHLYMYDYAGNGGFYTESGLVNIPAPYITEYRYRDYKQYTKRECDYLGETCRTVPCGGTYDQYGNPIQNYCDVCEDNWDCYEKSYYDWSSWSNWSTTVYTATSTRQVETRQVPAT